MKYSGDKWEAMKETAASVLAGCACRQKKITYLELARKISAAGFPVFYGGAKLRAILDEISEETYHKHGFILRAIVVYTDSGEDGKETAFSGKGFFALAKKLGRGCDDTKEGRRILSEEERGKIFAYYANPLSGDSRP
jgi:hypothetical protein